jgi:glycosyltransferase involved in cell wall biosynthesis
MKIVQIVTQMEAGGAQKVASLLTEGLRGRGHDAHLWFLYKKRPAYQESDHLRVFCSRRPNATEFAGLGYRLWQELRSQKPDAVITHTHSANSFAAPIAAAAQVPIRVAVHHNPVETYSTVMKIADQCAFATGCYSKMVTVSGGVTDSFSHHNQAYQRRLHRIYNGIAHSEAGCAIDARVRYEIPAHMKLVVNVGRLAQQKNQGLLLHMLQHVPDAFLLLVGEGDLRRELFMEAVVLGVAERVRFTGELASDQVDAILRQADLFLLPSTYESFCLAAVEAMHCGLPVIASDLPCLREVLGDGQLFFPTNNVEDLSTKIRYLLNRKDKREEMSKAGQARAENYTIERMVGEYEQLLADASLYARPVRSATNNFGRFNPLGSIAGIHDHL